MAKRTFLAGATSQTIDVFIADSSSTTGAGLSGLTAITTGLVGYYRVGPTGTATAITFTTIGVGSAYLSGGFVEVSAANMKGVYRVDLPNIVLSAAPWATLYISGAANAAPDPIELEIVAYNPFNGTTLGLTNLDAAVSTRATPAQVKTQMTDALNVDTYGQPSGAPASTATLVSKISFLSEAQINQVNVTATSKAFYNSSGALQWSKALTDDGVTYSEAKGA